MDPEETISQQEPGVDGGTPPALEPEPDLAVPEVVPTDGGSLLDTLRAKREEIAQRAVEGNNFLDIDVPGYGGRLFVRYRYPDGGWQLIKAIMAQGEKSTHPLAELFTHAGILIACCEQVLGRDEDGANENPDPDGEILTFDERLAVLLRIEIPSTISVKGRPRFILRQLFSPEQAQTGDYAGDIAVSAAAIRVAAWMETREGESQESFVGES